MNNFSQLEILTLDFTRNHPIPITPFFKNKVNVLAEVKSKFTLYGNSPISASLQVSKYIPIHFRITYD